MAIDLASNFIIVNVIESAFVQAVKSELIHVGVP